ncbi:uncharacterized protein LOC114361753 [Ostrinia furnacalis]|uniref:uncharacterized protein LOC114361753 n=1 Tax=Ostrinia furnacalis TaxID=93504 RepID=UPI001039700A|nr:uncharacterized protein LOC114361753 [Ostrinia furnacalis]
MTDASSIMSIRELIDTAFGDANVNIVNHKLIQTILVILARQLRLLERRVEVEIPAVEYSSGTSLSVTEVKLQANVPRKKKGKGAATSATFAGATSSTTAAGQKGLRPGQSQYRPGMQEVASKASAMSYDKTSSSGTKSTTDRSKSTSDKTSTEKSSSGFTSSATKSTTDKSSSDRTSSLKTSSDKTSSDKTSTEKTSSSKTQSETEVTKSSSEKKTTLVQPLPQDYQKRLEKIEEQRERELRIIHQRADSREEQEKTPTPMASLESMEKQYEKLLIVERVPSDKIKAAEIGGKSKPLSVVTQDEFMELATIVRQLQDRYKIAGAPSFPENAKLLNDLRKGASLTDAMAALQLSARVEAAEKTLERLLAVVTEIVVKIYVGGEITGPIDVEALIKLSQGLIAPEQFAEVINEIKEMEETEEPPQAAPVPAKRKSTMPKEALAKSKKSIVSKAESKESVAVLSMMDTKLPSETEVTAETAQEPAAPEEESKEKTDSVTYEELDNALQELYDECLKMVTTSTNRSNTNANNAIKIANRLEGRLEDSLNLGDRMFDLEKLVSEYADQINTLDTGLSSQMTNYQEQLTQMQHDLESGLEAMAEALANTGGDTAAVAELNNHFTNLQTDLDTAASRQKELRDIQNALSLDLQSLWKQIEILRDTKSDRDEVADALRDKAGLGALNGLVSRQEFDAVRGDFEKRIGSAYDKFNNQEIVWQKAIDDLIRELNEKADWIQVVSLQGSINKYLEKFRNKIREMEEVVGEPRAATVSRKLHRDAECLSCATAAHMDIEEPNKLPLMPGFPSSRPPAIGAEAKTKPSEDGDHRGVCYPGMPVPHAIDPRAHVCHRYCGGSHTLINNTLSRAPAGMIINPALREVSTAVGTDGRLYMVDGDNVKKPCLPCNYKKTFTTPEPSEAEPAPMVMHDDFGSDMTPQDYRQQSMQATGGSDIVSVTPPPPMDDD